MEKRNLVRGEILQINPDAVPKFPGFLLVCTEPKEWGCQGYLISAYEIDAVKYQDRAFIRVKFEDMEPCGRLEWMIEEDFKELEEND